MKQQQQIISSQYQQNIYNKLITTKSNIAVSASAGSGKTSTLVEIAKILPYGKKAIFIAFNKHIVKELKERLPSGVECSTMHSLGCKAIFNYYGGEKKINDKKQIGHIEPLFAHKKENKEKWKSVYAVDRLMKLARATMTKANKEDLTALIERYVVDIDEEEISATIKALRSFESYNSDPDRYNITIDFQDMISIPALMNISVPKYDYVLIDEGQDMSVLDRLFLNKLVKPNGGRKIILGDKNQAIYSFRGADINSFSAFANEPNTIQLPLSICYRCTKAIVREAKKVYPEIEENPDGEEGVEPRKGEIEEIQENDMVLCRNTRPLIEVFLNLIESGKKAYIVGKEMEQGLLGMLANIDGSEKTNIWFNFKEDKREKILAELTKKGVKAPDKNVKYQLLMEKLSILQLLFGKFNHVYEVEDFIKEIFEDEERDGVKLLTIHKSKGLEQDRVFIIREFEGKELIPSQYAVTEEMLIAEDNLKFVSITRAKKELIYLDL